MFRLGCQMCWLCRTKDALVATCKRHVLDLLGLDMSHCNDWLPFIQVHYQRPSSSMDPEEMEHTEVILC
jgi:hypothetical protein